MSDSLWVRRMEGQIEEGDLVRLRGKWQETMAKIHGASPAPRAAPEYAHMPHKACQPCDALCAERFCVTIDASETACSPCQESIAHISDVEKVLYSLTDIGPLP